MQQFVAMLRGINVAGRKPLKMEALRASFKALGFTEIRTYVQSGNVIFGAAGLGEPALVKKIETKLLRDLGLLKREIAAGTASPRTSFYLAQTYRDLGRRDHDHSGGERRRPRAEAGCR